MVGDPKAEVDALGEAIAKVREVLAALEAMQGEESSEPDDSDPIARMAKVPVSGEIEG